MDSSERPVFVAHPLSPPYLRKTVEDAVEAFDNAWLLPPQQGEVFETAKACFRRLQAYALSHGFAVVTITSKKTRAQFANIHYSAVTKNWRKLKDHIKKNKDNNIMSKRKREDTSSNARNYI